jgi:hypothetical protein
LCGKDCVDTMSDSKNCGQCGHDCQGNFCSSGLCLATGITVGVRPVQLAVDPGFVFFTDLSGFVGRVPKAGGMQATLATGLSNPYGVTVNATNVYFTCQGTVAAGYDDGAVFMVPIFGVSHVGGDAGSDAAEAGSDAAEAGSDAAEAGSDGSPGDAGAGVPIATKRPNPQSIVVDDVNVYWLELGTSTDNGFLLSCPLAGCPANTPHVISSTLGLPYGLAIDANNLYVTTAAGGQVLQFSKATGKLSLLADMQQTPQGIAAANGLVYWATAGDGVIQAIAPDGGSPATVAETMGIPLAIAVDPVHLFWSDTHPDSLIPLGPVNSCLVGGCPPAHAVMLVSPPQTASQIAIDDLFVYWIASAGQILRVAK